MINNLVYVERLPRYVFNSPEYKEVTVKTMQLAERLMAALLLLASIYLVLRPKTEHDLLPVWGAVITIWAASIVFLYDTEKRYQPRLDGRNKVVIQDDTITIPRRVTRKLTGRPDRVRIDELDHVVVLRGSGFQQISNKNGVIWETAPIGLKIVTKSGKKYNLGFKPPNTVKEITELLSTQWKVKIQDSGSGMGKGLRYIDGRVAGEHSYDEIMRMNLFEWGE